MDMDSILWWGGGGYRGISAPALQPILTSALPDFPVFLPFPAFKFAGFGGFKLTFFLNAGNRDAH